MAARGRPKNKPRNVDRDWFEARFHEINSNQNRIAASIDKSPSIMTRVLTGDRHAAAEEVAALSRILQVSAGEILRRFGYDVPMPQRAIRGVVKKGAQVSYVSPLVGQTRPIPWPGERQRLLVVEDNTGDALAPYCNAWILYREPAPGEPLVPLDVIGRLCVVEDENHVTPFVGTVTQDKKRGPITLVPFPFGEPIEVNKIIKACPVTNIVLPE